MSSRWFTHGRSSDTEIIPALPLQIPSLPIPTNPYRKIIMKNAHERLRRFGIHEAHEGHRTTRIQLRLDRFIGEVEDGRNGKPISFLFWAATPTLAHLGAVIEQNLFTVEAPGIEPVTASLGEDAQCFRGTITIAAANQSVTVAISAELAKTRPGADPGGRRTILCDNDPTFVLYRIAQRFGLPGRAGVGRLINEEINRRGAIKPLIGVGCSPVMVSGTKKLFLKWIRSALRQKRIEVLTAMGRSAGAWPTVSSESSRMPSRR